MTNEEIYLSSKMGHKNPFTVPEGYFDSLADRVMQKLPEDVPVEQAPRVTLVRKLRPLLYAAACLCFGILSVTIYLHSSADESPMLSSNHIASQTTENYVDEVADYAMIDNYDIYSCLASE
jgi:hypothetical protein